MLQESQHIDPTEVNRCGWKIHKSKDGSAAVAWRRQYDKYQTGKWEGDKIAVIVIGKTFIISTYPANAWRPLEDYQKDNRHHRAVIKQAISDHQKKHKQSEHAEAPAKPTAKQTKIWTGSKRSKAARTENRNRNSRRKGGRGGGKQEAGTHGLGDGWANTAAT